MPKELSRIRSMDEWAEMPREFRARFRPYVEEEFRRRREGFWFYNNGTATYITGRHYMMLQWTKLDIGHPYFLNFQREIFLHMAACEADPRCIGQLYTKCRRSGYTNICSAVLVDEATQVKDKLMGIQSKTGKDAQENIFMKKVVYMFRNYPFFYKPIQEGTFDNEFYDQELGKVKSLVLDSNDSILVEDQPDGDNWNYKILNMDMGRFDIGVIANNVSMTIDTTDSSTSATDFFKRSDSAIIVSRTEQIV